MDECCMDFPGQRRAEKYLYYIITLFGIVGLIWGYAVQQFSQALYILGAGTILAAILTIPSWPIYRRARPLNWVQPRDVHSIARYYRVKWFR